RKLFCFLQFFLLLRRPRRRSRRFTPATLTGVAGRPMRASASVAVISAAGAARPDATARPRREKAFRREIASDVNFSPIITSCAISSWQCVSLIVAGRDRSVERPEGQQTPRGFFRGPGRRPLQYAAFP